MVCEKCNVELEDPEEHQKAYGQITTCTKCGTAFTERS